MNNHRNQNLDDTFQKHYEELNKFMSTQTYSDNDSHKENASLKALSKISQLFRLRRSSK